MDAPDGLPLVPTIDAATLVGWLRGPGQVTILDVRASRDHAEWAIPGSINVDAHDALWARDPSALSAVALPRGGTVVAVCGAGRTSRLAAAQLAAAGHRAFSLDRGMQAWSTAWNAAEIALPPGRDGAGVRLFQVRRLGKGCLSYLFVAGPDALLVDPCLEPEVYTGLAAAHGAAVGSVVETHVHADHLSRARAVAAVTGARVLVPDQRRTTFEHDRVRDGDVIRCGAIALHALRTPGHTGESTCYLLEDAALLTGDTLAVRGVGRPDLEGGRAEATERARDLHASLQRLLRLPPVLLVLPGHTPDPVPVDDIPVATTLGEAARHPLLQLDEAAFIVAVVRSLPAEPPHYAAILRHNEQGTQPSGDPVRLEAGANRCAVA